MHRAHRLHLDVLEDRQLLATALAADSGEAAAPMTPPAAIAPEIAPATEVVDARTLASQFQALLDGPQRVVDLGGQTWVVPTRLIISTQHSGKVIQNGTIRFTFEGDTPRMGGMEIVQGRKWYDAEGNTVWYPEGDIDLTLRDLVIDGSFPYDFGLQEQTESVADQMNKGFNLITTITRPANNINLNKVRFQNSGNSAIAGSFRTFVAQDITADRIAKHVIGLRGFGGVKAQINRLSATQSGNVIDFHNEGDFYDEQNPDVAVVRNVVARNIRGRSKVAGNNWSIYGENWWFEQDNVVNLNLHPAFDLAKNPRRFVVDGFVAINFPTSGFGTLADTKWGGQIRLSNVTIRNSLAGIKVQQLLTLYDSEFAGTLEAFRSDVPAYEWNNVITASHSEETWATIYERIHRLYLNKNVAWGTDYTPRYWAPTSVLSLMD